MSERKTTMKVRGAGEWHISSARLIRQRQVGALADLAVVLNQNHGLVPCTPTAQPMSHNHLKQPPQTTQTNSPTPEGVTHTTSLSLTHVSGLHSDRPTNTRAPLGPKFEPLHSTTTNTSATTHTRQTKQMEYLIVTVSPPSRLQFDTPLNED